MLQGGVSVSMECFGHLTHLLLGAATLAHRQYGIVLALEGGYNLTSTSEALSNCVASLLSDTCPRLSGGFAPTDRWVPFLFPFLSVDVLSRCILFLPEYKFAFRFFLSSFDAFRISC